MTSVASQAAAMESLADTRQTQSHRHSTQLAATSTRTTTSRTAADNGTFICNTRSFLDQHLSQAASATFPTPLIRPRQRRPHTIHIVSYPPGYIPTELRALLQSGDSRFAKKKAATPKAQNKPKPKPKHGQSKRRGAPKILKKFAPTIPSSTPAASSGSSAINKLLSALFVTQTTPPHAATPTGHPHQPLPSPPPKPPSRPISLISLGRRFSLPQSYTSDQHSPVAACPQPPVSDAGQSLAVAPMTRNPVVADALRIDRRGSSGSHSNRNSFISVRSVKNIITSSVSEVTEKPVASGGGLTCSIFLAEPNVFLTGFDHDGRTTRSSDSGTALLRGKLQLNVTRSSKIRAITLKLHGNARTEWPEGIPPLKLDLYEEESLRTQALTFFHAMHESWEIPYGNQCTYALKVTSDSFVNSTTKRSGASDSGASGLSAKDIKRLSLQQVQARSFGKGDSPLAHPVQAKGYKIFSPGTYEYSFELPIDHHQLETIKLPFGWVKWELAATVERAGAFKPNLHGAKEVNIIRVPDQLSLETIEPISISRQWEDQLFYDIVISGKSFPIGSKIPIAFKLTPLAKVQLHKLKVYVTETAEYWTNNRRVTRKDPGRKILLFEKVAGKPLDPKYEDSEIEFLRGGELSAAERADARETAIRRRVTEAARIYGDPVPLPDQTDNLLGDLDLGLEAFWDATEIEMNVQMPTCDKMAKDPALRLHPDCSWRNVNIYHWIKVVMRISRLDKDDPEGKRRRHFEISIDSPFTVLHCLATQANTALPQYSGVDSSGVLRQRTSDTCGCHDAALVPTPTSSAASIDMGTAIGQQNNLPMPPPAAHLQTQGSDSPLSGTPRPSGEPRRNRSDTGESSQDGRRTALSDQEAFESPRPIHLLRVPSFAPPAFDADESPPIALDMATPPPNYDTIVGTPSVDGLADYFSRLANYEHGEVVEDESDSDSDNISIPTRIASRGGRVNVRTPGARHGPSRSMDIERPSMPFHLSMASVLRRNAE